MDRKKRKFLLGSLSLIGACVFSDYFKKPQVKRTTSLFKSVALVRYPKGMSTEQVFKESEKWIDRKRVERLDKEFIESGRLLSVVDQLDTEKRSYSIARTFSSEESYSQWLNQFQQLSVINHIELKKSPFVCHLLQNV